MLPEVQAWVDAYEAADETYRRLNDEKRRATDEEVNALPNRHSDAWYAERQRIHDVYYNASRALDVEREETRQAADAKLKADTDLPIIGWMLDNVDLSDYRHHVTTVLRALPLTRAQLVALARHPNNQWCNVFNQYLRQMDAAGVLPDGDQVEAKLSELEDYLRSGLGVHQGHTAHVKELAKEISDLAVKKKVDELTGRVDAAWQGIKDVQPAIGDLAAAETLFRHAVHFILTGEDKIAF